MDNQKENVNQELEENEVEENVEVEVEQENKKDKTSKRKFKKDKKNEEVEKLQEEIKTQKESYLRLMAEYDNFRKRTANEKLNIYADATAKAVTNLLTVADSLDMAMVAAENAPEEFKKGLDLLSQQFVQAFDKMNIEAFGKIGDEFNPEMHNAVSKIEDEELGENTIAQVFQKGFKLGDKIIRYAMVQVANCD